VAKKAKIKTVNRAYESDTIFCRRGHLMRPEEVEYEGEKTTLSYCRKCDEYYKLSGVDLSFKEKIKTRKTIIIE